MYVLLADRTFYRTKVSATEYATVGPIRNGIKFFLAAISDTLHFFLSTLILSLYSRLRLSGHHCTVEPPLSGHPRVPGSGRLMETGSTTEVPHKLVYSLAET